MTYFVSTNTEFWNPGSLRHMMKIIVWGFTLGSCSGKLWLVQRLEVCWWRSPQGQERGGSPRKLTNLSPTPPPCHSQFVSSRGHLDGPKKGRHDHAQKGRLRLQKGGPGEPKFQPQPFQRSILVILYRSIFLGHWSIFLRPWSIIIVNLWHWVVFWDTAIHRSINSFFAYRRNCCSLNHGY